MGINIQNKENIMKKKKLIIASVSLIIIVIATIFIYQYIFHKKEEVSFDGTYSSDTGEVTIAVSNGTIRIIENEKDYIYNRIYDKIYNDKMDREAFDVFARTAIDNMANGTEYSLVSDTMVIWPVEGDAATFSIYPLEDGKLSFFNKIYTKK